MWYVIHFNARYHSSEEKAQRFKIFVDNLKSIDERNERELKANGEAVHGMYGLSYSSTPLTLRCHITAPSSQT